MISYSESIDGVSASDLSGFFVGWPNPPAPAMHLYARLGMQPYTGMILRNYDRQSGAP